MANKKITELNNLETPSAADVFVVVDIENDETKKVTLANLKPVIDTIASSNINTVVGQSERVYYLKNFINNNTYLLGLQENSMLCGFSTG